MYVNLFDNDPSSCLIRFGKLKARALIDSGAQVSLISSQFARLIKNVEMNKEPSGIALKSVNGSTLSVKGRTNLQFHIGKQSLNHSFYVASHVNQSVILGRDFFQQNSANLRFDQCCLELNGEAIPLEESNYISSLIKVVNKVHIKPQTSVLCKAKVKGRRFDNCHGCYVTSAIDTGAINQEPGLTIANGVVKLKGCKNFPVLIVNGTNKHYKLNRGFIIGKIEKANSVSTIRTNLLNDSDVSNGLNDSYVNDDNDTIENTNKRFKDC